MKHTNTQRLAGLALLTAIVVVLQLIATFVHFGPFSVTLTLIPIVIGAAIYGPPAGALLGFVFGVVVTLACILGWDVGGNILWNVNPFLTALVCLVKGAAAGFAAGGLFRLMQKHANVAAPVLAGLVSVVTFLIARQVNPLAGALAAGLVSAGAFLILSRSGINAGVGLAAVICPVVNTGIFLLALGFLFHDTLVEWAGGAGADLTTYMLTGLVGVNFLVELAVNVVLSPVIVRILGAKGSAGPRS